MSVTIPGGWWATYDANPVLSPASNFGVGFDRSALGTEPLATAPNSEPVDCRSTAAAAPDDAASFAHGFATVTFLTGDTQTVTSTTAWPR